VWPCSAPPPGQRILDSNVWTNSTRRSPHTRPLPLAPSLQSAPCVRAPPLRHTKLSLLPVRVCRCVDLSPPSLPPCVGLHCFYTMHSYKRRPPLHLIRNRVVSAPSEPSPPHHLCLSTALSVPRCLTPPLSPCTGPRALQGPEAASNLVQVTPSPLLSSSTVDRIGELPPPRRSPS
jgi:hypothetical protein